MRFLLGLAFCSATHIRFDDDGSINEKFSNTVSSLDLFSERKRVKLYLENSVNSVITESSCAGDPVSKDLALCMLVKYKFDSSAAAENIKKRNLRKRNRQECPTKFILSSAPGYCEICREKEQLLNACSIEDHQFCEGCWVKYVKNEILDGNTLAFSCPSCSPAESIITISLIKKILPAEYFKKAVRYAENTLIAASPKWKNCSNPKSCDGIVDVSDPLCDECLFLNCSDCDSGIHPTVTCDFAKSWAMTSQADSALSNQVIDELDIVNCPACKTPIEKNDGCNQMTCKICKDEFCMECLSSRNSYHHKCPGKIRNQVSRTEIVEASFASLSASFENLTFLILSHWKRLKSNSNNDSPELDRSRRAVAKELIRATMNMKWRSASSATRNGETRTDPNIFEVAHSFLNEVCQACFSEKPALDSTFSDALKSTSRLNELLEADHSDMDHFFQVLLDAVLEEILALEDRMSNEFLQNVLDSVNKLETLQNSKLQGLVFRFKAACSMRIGV
jgi:IBR domain, a half RING-finger domain